MIVIHLINLNVSIFIVLIVEKKMVMCRFLLLSEKAKKARIRIVFVSVMVL